MFIFPFFFCFAPLFWWYASPETYNFFVGQHFMGLFMDYENKSHEFQTIWSLVSILFFVIIGRTIHAYLKLVRLAEEVAAENAIGIDWGRTETPHKGIGKTHRWSVNPKLSESPRKAYKPRRKTS